MQSDGHFVWASICQLQPSVGHLFIAVLDLQGWDILTLHELLMSMSLCSLYLVRFTTIGHWEKTIYTYKYTYVNINIYTYIISVLTDSVLRVNICIALRCYPFLVNDSTAFMRRLCCLWLRYLLMCVDQQKNKSVLSVTKTPRNKIKGTLICIVLMWVSVW